MKKSSSQLVPDEASNETGCLELPDAPDFISLPPSLSVDQTLMLNEQTKEWFPRSVPTREERWLRKVNVEFVL